MAERWQRFMDFIQNYDHPIGISHEMSMTDRWCLWVSFFNVTQMYAYRWKIEFHALWK